MDVGVPHFAALLDSTVYILCPCHALHVREASSVVHLSNRPNLMVDKGVERYERDERQPSYWGKHRSRRRRGQARKDAKRNQVAGSG